MMAEGLDTSKFLYEVVGREILAEEKSWAL